ncbi:hypothetical protein [Galbibacter mesophilus]|uniref:hypothetical protein n=1 Tax=Galbibacter mesophilus TaxID=379069 RepID=UPI00191D9094|nr:hypothetical protein [Galbibacter mesophilus]MCM5663177.1 hypothetical protein [Galbibacter mesophilus]
MSEHITHIAVYEDSVRMISKMTGIPKAFSTAVKNQPDAGLISSGARGNHLFAIPIIEEVRDRWENRKPGDGTEEKLAAAIGWLSHRAIDLQVKPNYIKSEDIKDPHFSSYENQIYCDAITFSKVYNHGKAASISSRVAFSGATLETNMQSHPGATLLHQPYIEHLLCSLTQQQLIGIRKFNETASNIDEWLDAFPSEYQKLSENLEVYIEAYQSPDPKKMKRYIDDLNFYDDKDEIIQMVREIQQKGSSGINVEQAAEKGRAQSHYAQGLARSYRFISSAADFFNRKISKEQVYDQVEIFTKSHRI